jgi:uncharacterized lipoprotein YmbA
VSGCIGSSSTSKYYLLEAIDSLDDKEVTAEAKIQIALAPVKIPKYVNRPQIVSAIGKNSYHISEANRWAEGLDENLSRVLQQNLSVLVPSVVLLTKTSKLAKKSKFRVDVNVLEFYVNPQGLALLVVQWNVRIEGQNIVSRQNTYQSPASYSDYRIMVRGLNQCIDLMSYDIAKAIQRISFKN